MKGKKTWGGVIRAVLFFFTVTLIVWGMLRPSEDEEESFANFDIQRRFRSRYTYQRPRPVGAPDQPKPTPRPTDIPSKMGKSPNKAFAKPQTTWHISGVPTDPVRTEAFAKIGAGEYHMHGHTGQGVKVAIIDSEFQGVAARIKHGELPPDLVTRQFFNNGNTSHKLTLHGGDHGTACAEIIHDIAPDAQLYLIQVESLANTLGNVLSYLHTEDVRIVSIAMSIFPQGQGNGQGMLGDPRSPIYDILRDARQNKNMLIIKSAGNYARQHYSGDFKDSNHNGWHEFGQRGTRYVDERLSLYTVGETDIKLYFSWDAWDAGADATTRYRLYLYDEAGQRIRESTPMWAAANRPVEYLGVTARTATTYELSIQKRGEGPAQRLNLFIRGEGVVLGAQQVKAGSLGPPADAPDILAVGAAKVFDDTRVSYSSQGPTTDGRIKPDLTGYAAVSVFEPPGGVHPFMGTSAAAAHIAGMAALLASTPGHAGLSAAALQAQLLQAAADKGTRGKDNAWGAGLAQLPPLDPRVNILTATHAGQVYVKLSVRRADDTHIPGLLRDTFVVKIDGQPGQVLSARDLGAAYLLDILPPTAFIPTTHTLDIAVTAFSPPSRVTRSVAISSTRKGDPVPTLHVVARDGVYRAGNPVTLLASLAHTQTLSQVRVVATIERPDATQHTLALHDDGMHADGVAGDGVYGGMYRHTWTPGTYHFALQAQSNTPSGNAPVAQAQCTVVVRHAAQDSDNDRMSDDWEHQVGLRTSGNDAYQDPDADRLNNLDEFLQGTDPYNWDTDEDGLSDHAELRGYYHTDPANFDTDLGGVGDGAELQQGTNPTDPADDGLDRNRVYLPDVMR